MSDAAPPGELGPVVFVPDLARPELSPDDRHHLERVLRLRRGDPLVCGDGAGRWVPCRLDTALEPLDEVRRVARPLPAVRVGFALVKGDKPELIVQKLTEVGVDRIVPFTAERSVVRWDPSRARAHTDRLRRVAAAAASQCRRVWLPEVEEVTSFDVLALSGSAALADPSGDPPGPDVATVLVGPEGGWAPSERAALERRIRFGEHVMRAETAAIVVGATLVALRGGLVQPAS